ncbi:ABC transporter substrate-binding protein [Pusillimonas sp. CC-YST705]|uniref:ABC transporter substrate-binding protein n=1 Tax=Mesopusillimonas faecipullorum TaxID=2755040 RepID=A0ABS8CH25_9BURK|nr:ABC transporter substrate-binding protein [Mesopusillimonas faecipullorum]MCB5364869.1 ABC transporter substrate-binding protein [Mesopusillimonas faecipullorum]
MKTTPTLLKCLLATAGLACVGAAQADIKLGFMGPMSGPLAITGQDLRRGLDLALEHLDGKLGGETVTVVAANDQANPSVATSELTRLIEQEKIDVLMGIAASNVAMAIAQPATQAGLPVLYTHAGPGALAGKACAPNLFALGHQNDQYGEAMGRYMKDQGVKNLYAMGLDYQAGWEMVDAALHGFGGKASAKVYTPMGQVDFAPELSRVRNSGADGLYVFYPGGAAVAFVRQFAASGLKNQVQLYSVGALVDPTVIGAQADAALGVISANTWNAGIDNPQNQRFLKDFVAKHDREPTTFAAQTYDAVMYLDAALKKAGGAQDRAKLIDALRHNDGFQSIRGNFKLNRNHFPIQDMVIQQVEKTDGGYQQKILAKIEDVSDRYVDECEMKW